MAASIGDGTFPARSRRSRRQGQRGLGRAAGGSGAALPGNFVSSDETLAPAAPVSHVARAHGVNANQLFGWRRLFLGGRLRGSETRIEVAAGSSERELAKRRPRSSVVQSIFGSRGRERFTSEVEHAVSFAR